jgi:serine/threonine protein kinase
VSAISIPGYKIIKTLGVGGQATVYLAIQEGFEREIALKVMSPALAADPSFGERFIREAKIVAKLRHPGIVTVFDVGEHDGFYYLAMEYLPETDLRSRITQGIKAKEALVVIQKVAKALHYAHDKGYIHRDVKSENILFRDDGEPVLTDFGIAKASNSSTQMTQQGKLIGTPQYMSPEQCRGRKLDGRSDIYSLGIILYEMLTQKVPFDGEDSVAVCLQHVTKPIPRLSARQKHYQWLLDRLLAKKAEDRFDDGEKLASEIDRFLSGDITQSQHTSSAEMRASRDDDHTAIFDHDDDIVADERIYSNQNRRESKKTSRWPWVIGVLVIASTAAYYQKALWLPKATELYFQVTGQTQPSSTQKPSTPSTAETTQTDSNKTSKDVVAETQTNQSNDQQNAISDAEEEAKQKQIAQLLIEADTLEPLTDLDPAQIRNLLQNYVRVLVLDETNQKAIAGKQNAIERAANYAKDALNNNDEASYQQYVSVIEATAPEHAVLAPLQKQYAQFKQQQENQVAVSEKAARIDSLLKQAEQAMQENRLTTPEQTSAYHYFNAVLALDSQNEMALQGLNDIEQKYTKLAQQALLNKNPELALSNINKLESISGKSEQLTELKDQYKLIKKQVDEARKIAAVEQKKKQQEAERQEMLADPLVQLKLNSKLNSARSAYAENRLVEPESDNALSKYKEVLAIDPDNQRAKEGITLVNDKLSGLVKSAIQNNDKLAANSWLSKLKQYFPDSDNIPLFTQQISELDIELQPEQSGSDTPSSKSLSPAETATQADSMTADNNDDKTAQETGNTEQGQAVLQKPEQSEPVKNDANKQDSENTDSKKTDSKKTDSKKSEPEKTELKKTEPEQKAQKPKQTKDDDSEQKPEDDGTDQN